MKISCHNLAKLTRLMRQKHLKSVELCEILSFNPVSVKSKTAGFFPQIFSLSGTAGKSHAPESAGRKTVPCPIRCPNSGHLQANRRASAKRLLVRRWNALGIIKEECLDTPVSAKTDTVPWHKMAVTCGDAAALPQTLLRADRYTAGGSGPVRILGRCVASCGDTVSMR